MAFQEFSYTFALNDTTFIDILVANHPFLKVKSLRTNLTSMPLADVKCDSTDFTDALEDLRKAASEANEPDDTQVTLTTEIMDASLTCSNIFPSLDMSILKYLGPQPEIALPQNLMLQLSAVIDTPKTNFISLEERREDCWKALMIINKDGSKIEGAYDVLGWGVIFVKLNDNRIIRIAYQHNGKSKLHPFLDHHLDLGLDLQEGFFAHDENSRIDNIYDATTRRYVPLKLDYHAETFSEWDGQKRLMMPANNPFSEITRELDYICKQAKIQRDENRRALASRQSFHQAIRLAAAIGLFLFAGTVFKYGLFTILHTLSLIIFAAGVIGIGIYGIKHRQQIWHALCHPQEMWEEWGANTFDPQKKYKNQIEKIAQKINFLDESLFGKEEDTGYDRNAASELTNILQTITTPLAPSHVEGEPFLPEHLQGMQWLNRQYERLCGIGKASKYTPEQIFEHLMVVDTQAKTDRIKEKYSNK